jgi:hypothetical protein
MIPTCLIALLSAAAPKNEPLEVAQPPPPPPPPAVQAPPPPGAGSFGIRAGLGGSTATPGIDVGNVGAKFMVTDGIVISFDVGLGLTTSSGYSQASFAADAVLGLYLRSRPASLRPYVPILFGVGFASRTQQQLMQVGSTVYPVNTQTGGFSLAIGGGIGAEYWFSPSFSVAAELLLRLAATSLDPIAVQIGTLTPGVHATYWF